MRVAEFWNSPSANCRGTLIYMPVMSVKLTVIGKDGSGTCSFMSCERLLKIDASSYFFCSFFNLFAARPLLPEVVSQSASAYFSPEKTFA